VSELQIKQPPHSTESEQSVLGALLLDNSAFENVSWLSENAFYADQHRRIWACLARMIEAGRLADVVTVSEELGHDLEKAGGPAYIGALAQGVPSALNIRAYARVVYEKSVQRELATVCTSIAEEALAAGSRDVGQMLDEAESRILRIAEQNARSDQGPVELPLAKVFERIDHLYHRSDPSAITGVPTGLLDLDRRTDGLQAGDLIIIAARPSMGKTALALNIAEHVAVEHRMPVVIFSMEMSATQLTNRLLGSIAKVDQHKMRTGRLADNEWMALTEAMSKLHEVPIRIDEAGALTVLEIRARARRMRRRMGKLGLVVIDYLQLMEAKAKGENRATDIAEMTRSLKAMAKELDCPVVALSQLSRKVDERGDRRPIMSDLRESGAIEQDADLILFLYREAAYNPNLPEEERPLAELIIGKQRNGPVGTVKLMFFGQHTRFENYAGNMDFAPRRKRPAKNFYEWAEEKA
jgi:replicative DNA helicase